MAKTFGKMCENLVVQIHVLTSSCIKGEQGKSITYHQFHISFYKQYNVELYQHCHMGQEDHKHLHN